LPIGAFSGTVGFEHDPKRKRDKLIELHSQPPYLRSHHAIKDLAHRFRVATAATKVKLHDDLRQVHFAFD